MESHPNISTLATSHQEAIKGQALLQEPPKTYSLQIPQVVDFGFPIKKKSQMTFSKSRTARGSAMVTDWNNTIQIQLGDHNQHAGHAPEVHTCSSPTLRRHNIAKQNANAKIRTGSCRGTGSLLRLKVTQR